MPFEGHQFTVFTKPWREMELAALGEMLHGMRFDGIELPVRDGYQVPPERVEELPKAAETLRGQGIAIASIAGPIDERTIAACGEAGVPVIRICVSIPKDKGYFDAVADCQRQWDALVPALDAHGVTIGVQNHCGRCIANAMQVRHAIARYEPKHVAAVWDLAHTTLDGEIPELALDILWSHLCMVNLKNPMVRNAAWPDDRTAKWERRWTLGRYGLADWLATAKLLKGRGWTGTVCLSAEYSNREEVLRLIGDDVAYAKSCFFLAAHAPEA
jgi:sugar phosphate isomerase/epimerase